jgi:signal transduction histidine kinase/HAMP domain-containing protein
MSRFRLFRYLLVIFGALGVIIVLENTVVLHRLSVVSEPIREVRLLVLLSALITLAFIVAAAILVSRLISQHLQRLLAAMEEVKQGTYPRLLVTGNDELSHLTRGFNQMVEELRTRDDKLKTWAGRREKDMARLSQTLEVERGKLETVLQSIGDGVIVLDNDNQVLMANRRVAEVFDISPEGIVGTDLQNLIARVKHRLVNPALVESQFRELQRNTSTVDEIVLQLDQPEGPEIRLYCAPVRGANGKLFGRIATSLDRSRERELDRLKSEFVSTISHELRTPLTSIKGSLGLIRSGAMGPVSPDLREVLDIALSNTDRLVTTINEMLDIGQLERGQMPMNTITMALRPSADLAVAAVQRQSQQRRVTIELSLPADLPAVIGDPKRVEQVFVNLLANAVKFSPPDSRVLVTAHTEDGVVVVSVRDSGVGIKKEFQERMFGKFEHQQGSLTRESQGAGLGLAISKQIIDALGGNIWVESEEGHGSTFFFTLPSARQAVLDGKKEEATFAGRAASGHCLVLVIEDDEDAAKLISYSIASQGHKVITCHNGKEAMQLARRHHPDIVTLDLNIPGINGLAVLKELRADEGTKRVPIICISAQPDSALALASGASFYLEKPVDIDMLREITQRAFAASVGGIAG